MDDSFRNGCCSKIDVASSIVIFLFALLLVSGMMVRQILGWLVLGKVSSMFFCQIKFPNAAKNASLWLLRERFQGRDFDLENRIHCGIT